MYQKSPIFAQHSVKVFLVNDEVRSGTVRGMSRLRNMVLALLQATRQLINENSICANLVKRMCKDLNINNPGEWGLYEIWDHADLPDMPGMRVRSEKQPGSDFGLCQLHPIAAGAQDPEQRGAARSDDVEVGGRNAVAMGHGSSHARKLLQARLEESNLSHTDRERCRSRTIIGSVTCPVASFLAGRNTHMLLLLTLPLHTFVGRR